MFEARLLAIGPVDTITGRLGSATQLLLFVVNTSVSATSVKELVALAQANPGKLNYASVGVGSAVHMATELFKLAAKVNIEQIPYKTGGEMVSGLCVEREERGPQQGVRH